MTRPASQGSFGEKSSPQDDIEILVMMTLTEVPSLQDDNEFCLTLNGIWLELKSMSLTTLLPLNSTEASLENAGGKGLNLVRLIQAGFPVPDGFLIPVAAYHQFIKQNDLGPKISSALAGASLEELSSLEDLSRTIRGWFSQGKIPQDLEAAIRSAYRDLGSGKVAVRSSATAEDLPEVSFAGQQDTYLNVVGEETVLEAVLKCWSSLWTARAIGYRHRNGIAQEGLGLAVVVQAMVPSQVSGVAFTANPLTGLRTETVMDATLGLGEALVSGKVEPDHYVVDTRSHQIKKKQLGSKALVIEGKSGGGTVERKSDEQEQQALPDEQILGLAELCHQVANLFGTPQDIEWAWAGGKLYLLQSRPVTSLYPTAEGVPYEPLRVMFSVAAIQGILEPFTPLGQDAIRMALTGLEAVFGYKADYRQAGLVQIAGERLWLGFTSLVKNSIGRKLASGIMSFVEPSIGKLLKSVMEEPELEAKEGVSLRTRLHLIWFVFPVFFRLILAIAFPKWRRLRGMAIGRRALANLEAISQVKSKDIYKRLEERLVTLKEITRIFPRYLPGYFVAPLAAGMASMNLVNQLLKRFLGLTKGDIAGMQQVMREMTLGLPYNVTTEMDMFLWETAQKIRGDLLSMSFFQQKTPEEISRAYLKKEMPAVAQAAVDAFIQQYGVRGVGEIDLGRPRWKENPLQIMRVLISYLNITDESKAPVAIFRQNAAKAEQMIAGLEAQIRRTKGGKLKAAFFRFATSRVRMLVGLRESPKFFIVCTLDIMRRNLQASGAELAEAGILTRPDDIFFLNTEELEALARHEGSDWEAIVAQHHQNYEREKLRRQIPAILFSDGRALYSAVGTGTADAVGILSGSPVSPGVVEGRVRVVFSPDETGLQPGEILVCPGTDPAWTPLFLAAGGLVMEVGGMMTHGAVVAREYGIPAIVGVVRATALLQTGQRVRVDGGSGVIEILGNSVHEEMKGDKR